MSGVKRPSQKLCLAWLSARRGFAIEAPAGGGAGTADGEAELTRRTGYDAALFASTFASTFAARGRGGPIEGSGGRAFWRIAPVTRRTARVTR